jgi:integrase
MSALITGFKASPAWNGKGPKPISEKTKASWSPWLDRIKDEFGTTPIVFFDRPAMRPVIIKWRDKRAHTARAADMGVQVLSRLLSFGMAEGKLMNNLCSGVGKIYANDRADLIWSAADLAILEKYAPAEIYQSAKLASLVGLRQADLLRLSWPHNKEKHIEIPANKSGRNGRKKRSAIIPLYAELKAYLATLPKRALTVLVSTEGEPWGTGFGSSWGKACAAAALKIEDPAERAAFDELHFHDLRGTAATKFFLAGVPTRAIAEIMVWKEADVEALIDRYVRRAAILDGLIATIDGNIQ